MIKCVVPISGGKDSQACLKMAVEKFGSDYVIGLFCDTGYEHPSTYKHIAFMEEKYRVRIERVCAGDVMSEVKRVGYFPTGIIRFCTDELKIKPAKKFYTEFAAKNGGFEVWFGMRLGESYDRSQRYKDHNPDKLYQPHEVMGSKFPKKLGAMGVLFRLPIMEWDTDDVFEYLDGDENELYKKGFDRVGCFPCLAGGDKWKEKAFSFDDVGKKRRIEVVQLGHELGQSVFKTKGGIKRNPDSIPQNQIEEDHQMSMEFDDVAPCFHCNI